MSLGDSLNKDVIDFQNEIRRTFYFIKDGFKIIESRINEADSYYTEFEDEIDWLKNNLKKLKNSNAKAKRIRKMLHQIDIVSRMYEFADTQQELAYRMAHVFMIAIYEGFTKEIFVKLYRWDLSLLVSRKYTLNKIASMSSDDIESLIMKKTDHIASVNELETVLSNPRFNIDIAKKFSRWNSLKENYYRRNAIVHKHGIYDFDYTKKAGVSSTLIRKKIETDFNYIKQLAHNICEYMGFLVGQLLSLFSLSLSIKDVEEDAKEILDRIDKHKKT